MFLQEHFDINFNNLFTITNLPVGRTALFLQRQKLYAPYLKFLEENFNATTLEHLMCRDQLSVDYLGNIYDCDFNQMLELPVNSKVKHISEYNEELLEGRNIVISQHCYGCTAGAGSSCQGTVA